MGYSNDRDELVLDRHDPRIVLSTGTEMHHGVREEVPLRIV